MEQNVPQGFAWYRVILCSGVGTFSRQPSAATWQHWHRVSPTEPRSVENSITAWRSPGRRAVDVQTPAVAVAGADALMAVAQGDAHETRRRDTVARDGRTFVGQGMERP